MGSTPVAPQQATDAVHTLGWRFVLGTLATCVAVSSLQQAAEVAAIAAGVGDADAHIRIAARPDCVHITVQNHAAGRLTALDVGIAQAVTAALAEHGHATSPTGPGRTVQVLEAAIDALDIPKVRPFWKAVLGYVDQPSTGALVDPAGQGPPFWFQQMDAPRGQRNRIHFDINIAHDEAQARISAALAAGGRVVSDARARAFWVLSDPRGQRNLRVHLARPRLITSCAGGCRRQTAIPRLAARTLGVLAALGMTTSRGCPRFSAPAVELSWPPLGDDNSVYRQRSTALW